MQPEVTSGGQGEFITLLSQILRTRNEESGILYYGCEYKDNLVIGALGENTWVLNANDDELVPL